MGSIHIRRVAVLAFALALAIGACSGVPGGAAANDPSGVVTAAFAAAQAGGITKLTDFACAAHKNDLAGAFGGASLGALTAAGVSADQMFGALSMSFANVTTREVSKTDTAATVHVTGDMTINVDKEKFKTVWKTMMQAQGQPVDDATIDAIVGQMATSISTTQKLDEDIKVVNEGGKWLLCE
ncbi:MAG: hypothetical protein QOE42_1796 [Chloroflexota bacterium]|jgi:hypothetical protein|nr:hypothetical protein [Chloroflexota bacterium]